MHRLIGILLLFCVIAIGSSTFPAAASAQPDAVFDLLGRIGALRRQNGLAPLELNDQLAAAAQRHSQDMANTDRVDHTGSDGSTPEQRMLAAGYGPTLAAWGENIYGGGISTIDDAWRFWTTSTVHRANLLNERYREIGIGVATSANGTYYTLNFGARPGVLPFFVDQGSLLNDPHITLTLSNEDATPGGSDGTMGRAVEIRAGEGDDLSGVTWRPWQRSIPFTLSSVAGQHRITVEYRDASGTAASYFRLVSLTGVQTQATATPANQPTHQPSNTPAPTATPEPTSTPTDTPTPTETPTLAATPTVTQIPSATLTAIPSPTGVSIILPTGAPGSRSLPTPPSGVRIADASISSVAAAPPGTPIEQPPLEQLVVRGWSDAPLDWLGLIGGLQIAAIVIAAVILVRRSLKP